MDTDASSLFEIMLERNGQQHILDMFPNIAREVDHPLHKHLTRIDIAAVKSWLRDSQEAARHVDDIEEVQPVSKTTNCSDLSPEAKSSILEAAHSAIICGSVAAVILSGGQGTRLGFDGPKGMYNLGMPSSKTLFQYHVEKVMKLSRLLSSCSIPIYVMTSDLNDAAIRAFFKDQNYFGYPESNFYFFEQDLLPCLTPDGKLIVESDTSVAMAPCGNGGIYSALESSGALADMLARGVKHLHVYGIDNVLTKPLDPMFIGLCIQQNADCGNKVVWRCDKAEKVGVTAESRGRFRVVEYSDLPKSVADAVDGNGKLLYGAANICNHYLSLGFLQSKVFGSSLTYHVANKKIPYLDAITRRTVSPTACNGIKLELFIFDVFPLAETWVVLEVPREQEFAPVKNEPCSLSDSPDTARALMSALSVTWLRAAGAQVAGDGLCEISPLLSHEGEGLEHYASKTIHTPCYLE